MSTLTESKNTDQLTDQEKEMIKQEVATQWRHSGEGIEQHNAEQAFSVFSKNEGTKYIRNGYLYPDIDTAKNQYAAYFNSPDAVKQKIRCDPDIYDILDRNTVLHTTIGHIEKAEKVDPNEKPWIIAYTLLWRKENDEWKLFHMHNSWE